MACREVQKDVDQEAIVQFLYGLKLIKQWLDPTADTRDASQPKEENR